jgi:hypothetical protein
VDLPVPVDAFHVLMLFIFGLGAAMIGVGVAVGRR